MFHYFGVAFIDYAACYASHAMLCRLLAAAMLPLLMPLRCADTMLLIAALPPWLLRQLPRKMFADVIISPCRYLLSLR